MTANETASTPPAMHLLPHQRDFVTLVAETTEPKVIVLEGDVGLGKSVALAATCAHILKTQPFARVLLLAHRALGAQFVSVLESFDVRATVVNRFKFREMLDVSDGQATWPQGQVSVLGWDFARQPDVVATLNSTRWTLLVADEAHSATGGRLEFLGSMIRVADRVVLATATPRPDGFAEVLGEPVKKVRWRRDDVLVRSGQNLSLTAPPTLRTVFYTPSAEEQELTTIVGSLSAKLSKIESGSLLAQNLTRARESGPAALEKVLRALLRRRVTTSLEEGHGLGDEASEYGSTESVNALEPETASLVTRALSALDALELDSKLDAFSAFIASLKPTAEADSRRICVVTDYASTLFYLAAELERHQRETELIQGEMITDERAKAFDRFASGSGVLLATQAALQGIELPNVTDVVLYDVPRTVARLEVILGRFNRVGRTGPLSIYVLASTAGPHPIDQTTRRALHDRVE